MQVGCNEPVNMGTVSVLSFTDYSGGGKPSAVLGSRNIARLIRQDLLFQSGWSSLLLDEFFGWYMESTPTSTAYDPIARTTSTGRFRVGGLPITGLMVRTFKNGTLHCGTAACQGNYGGSFSHRYRRSITYIGP